MRVEEISFEAPRAAATTVSVSTSSAQSAALDGGAITYVCDQRSYILFGSNPTATTSCQPVPADTIVRITNVKSGEKMAIIAAGSGTAHIVQEG